MKLIPYRHRPKGLTILYEDSDIIVIDKISGLLTVKATYEKEKGEPKSRLALHSHYLTFKHPHNGKELTFEAEVPGFFKNFFDNI